MKKAVFVLTLTIATAITAFVPATNPELEIGKAIPSADVKMMDVSGKEFSLADSKVKMACWLFFLHTCPYVKLSEARIKDVASLAKKNKIGVVLINSNEAQREDEDSFEEMKKYAKAQAYDFRYVVDKNSVVADAFGATRTPHVFLFDKKGLAYRGAIDDNIKDVNDAKEHYLKNAITAVGTGSTVKTNSTKSVGCSIKRVE
ncbi:MAG: redoxin domain-containing protein [Bacteroidetes bacterium]|nr:redoxin domain-containing protein [Bacteroidota bacterium]